MSDNNSTIIRWAADRFVHVHHDSPNVDYVLALRRAADAYDALLKTLEQQLLHNGWLIGHPDIPTGHGREFNVCYFANGKNHVTALTFFNDYQMDWDDYEGPITQKNFQCWQKQDGGDTYIHGWFSEDADEEKVCGFNHKIIGYQPLPAPMSETIPTPWPGAVCGRGVPESAYDSGAPHYPPQEKL